jgi:hypothetical protein
MLTTGIRAFVDRDWNAVRESTDAYWGERIARLGPMEGLRVAEELRRFMLLQNPDWPDAATRSADIAAHVRLAAILRRADSARRP